MPKYSFKRALTCFIAASLMICCSKLPSSTSSPSSYEAKQVLHVQLANEPISLDPTLAEDGVSLQILNNINSGLVGYDAEGKLQNRIAESYTISPDGTRYEFKLKPNARWSDGQIIQPQNFILALRRALSPGTVCKLAPLFFAIRGARSYHERKSSELALGIKESQGKLVIELERATPYFIQALTLPPAFPIRQDVLDKNHGIWPENAPSTGAYRMISHQIGQKIVLERNLNYWGKIAMIPRIELWVVVDESTAIHLFDHGQLDLLNHISSLDYLRLKKTGQIHTAPFLATYYLSFNCRKPPFNDRNWRRAIAGSIRRDEISTILGAGELPASSWIPKGLEGFTLYQDPRSTFSDSIEWVRNHHRAPEVITAAFDTGIRNSRVFEKIQHDVQQVLGIRILLNQLDWRTYIQTLKSNTPSIFRSGWMAPFMDPISHLKVFTTGNLNNYSGCSNQQYDLLVNQIEGMIPGAAREAKIRQAQKILVEDEAALVPIYHYVQNTGVLPRVRGFQVNSFGIVQFQDLHLE